MFHFRIITTPDGNQIIDRNLSTPYESLTPTQMVEYTEIDNQLTIMDVWYWDDPTKDFFEASAEQNKIREKYYILDRKTPTYIVAREEIKSGIEIPKHGEVLIDYAE